MNHYRCCSCNADIMTNSRPDECPSCSQRVILLWRSDIEKKEIQKGTLMDYMRESKSSIDRITESGSSIYFHMSDGSVVAIGGE